MCQRIFLGIKHSIWKGTPSKNSRGCSWNHSKALRPQHDCHCCLTTRRTCLWSSGQTLPARRWYVWVFPFTFNPTFQRQAKAWTVTEHNKQAARESPNGWARWRSGVSHGYLPCHLQRTQAYIFSLLLGLKIIIVCQSAVFSVNKLSLYNFST